MSSGNLFLGKARGRLGSVVLYELDGQPMARSYQARVQNPRTWRQAVQRSIAKTAYVAYSSLYTLCRQSYQGAAAGTASQTEYYRRNYRLLKDRIAEYYEAGEAAVLESAVGNYNGSSDAVMLLNPLMVSDGGLSSMGARVTDGGLLLPSSSALSATSTYADVCGAFAMAPGDVLDVLLLSATDGGVVLQIAHCRIVLQPSTEDMSAPFASGGVVNLPNEGNFGECSVLMGADGITFACRFVPNAGAVVRTHWAGNLRQLSPEWIALPADVSSLQSYALGRAVASLRGGAVYIDGG